MKRATVAALVVLFACVAYSKQASDWVSLLRPHVLVQHRALVRNIGSTAARFPYVRVRQVFVEGLNPDKCSALIRGWLVKRGWDLGKDGVFRRKNSSGVIVRRLDFLDVSRKWVGPHRPPRTAKTSIVEATYLLHRPPRNRAGRRK